MCCLQVAEIDLSGLYLLFEQRLTDIDLRLTRDRQREVPCHQLVHPRGRCVPLFAASPKSPDHLIDVRRAARADSHPEAADSKF
jgi:hypothetical protein